MRGYGANGWNMHGYGMDGWNAGWMWMFGVVAIIALVLIFRARR